MDGSLFLLPLGIGLLGLAGIAAAAGAVVWFFVTRELTETRRAAAVQWVLATFGPAQAAARRDPQQLLVWYPLAETGRRLFPEAFHAVDAAAGGPFPFSRDAVERAHARVSAEWLAWEKAHDEEYRLKAAGVEQELRQLTGDAALLAKARLDRVQHEKIERYQLRYEEYIRTAKALQALLQ